MSPQTTRPGAHRTSFNWRGDLALVLLLFVIGLVIAYFAVIR
ncbi:hypothetical protein [Limnochorda pilosa]|nr:hypothetical protein [Limnochorda pilosa]